MTSIKCLCHWEGKGSFLSEGPGLLTSALDLQNPQAASHKSD